MKLKKMIIVLDILIASVFLVACGKNEVPSFEGVSTEISSFVVDFYEAYKTGCQEATKYVYFTSEKHKEAFLTAAGDDVKIVSYEIKDIHKFSDSLYGIFVNGKDSTMDDEMTFKQFAALIDGEWKIVLNVNDLPKELSDGYDLSDYVYTSEDFDGADILGTADEVLKN